MIVERSMDSRYLSNAFVVGDEPGGVAAVSYTHLTLPTNREV